MSDENTPTKNKYRISWIEQYLGVADFEADDSEDAIEQAREYARNHGGGSKTSGEFLEIDDRTFHIDKEELAPTNSQIVVNVTRQSVYTYTTQVTIPKQALEDSEFADAEEMAVSEVAEKPIWEWDGSGEPTVNFIGVVADKTA